MIVLIVIGIIICIAGSHFFSSSEMSFSSCNEIRLSHEAESAPSERVRAHAKKALYIVNNFDRALSTILIGNNLVNIASSSLASVLVIMLTGSDSMTWIATVVMTLLVIIFGETIPKIIAKKKPNTLAMAYAPFIRVLMVLFFPLVWIVVKLVDLFTKGVKEEGETDEDESVEELQSMIETAEDEGILEKDQSELLKNAIDFAETSASEVMTARVDMDAIDIDDPMDEIMRIANKTRYSRLPVYEDSIDNIIGTLHMNKLFRSLMDDEDVDIRKLMNTPCFVYKTVKLPEVLDALRETNQNMAIVTDEYGGTAGLITVEDVLEEIVGEIWDESDVVEQESVQTGDNEYEVDGDMNIYDFFELVGLEEDDADEFESETVGGWMIEMLGHYPAEGEKLRYECPSHEETEEVLELTALIVNDRRVEKIRVKVL
ncbi:MAG: hemolysin family protein [Lachnospiraceae bacterium]|nr:hemolysin family protein [Lachnospiraceae bacterium]